MMNANGITFLNFVWFTNHVGYSNAFSSLVYQTKEFQLQQQQQQRIHHQFYGGGLNKKKNKKEQLHNLVLFMTDDDDEEEDTISLPESSKQLFDDMTQELLAKYRTSANTNPFASQVGQNIGKDSLYSNSELMDLLSIHNDIQMEEETTTNLEEDDDNNSEDSASLHDLIMRTVDEESTDNTSYKNLIKTKDNNNNNKAKELPIIITLDDEMKQKMTKICAIASDVDGTLLTSSQKIHPRTRLAIRRALDRASCGNENDEFVFFPATGKSRKGAMDSLGVEVSSWLEESNAPGVYLQGLYCVDGNGNVLFEKKLSQSAIAGVESLVDQYNISIVGYDGDDLYTTEQTNIVVHLHEHYGEPLPILLPPNSNDKTTKRNLADHGPGMHKLLIMDDDTDKLSNIIRPQLEAVAEKSNACVTQAIPTMLEVLPKGCSKALGVSKVCEALNIDMATQLLALGDAENDAEMLRQASIGVAVGNGCTRAKDAADFVMHETNNDGGAGAAMEIFGFGPSFDRDIF